MGAITVEKQIDLSRKAIFVIKIVLGEGGDCLRLGEGMAQGSTLEAPMAARARSASAASRRAISASVKRWVKTECRLALERIVLQRVEQQRADSLRVVRDRPQAKQRRSKTAWDSGVVRTRLSVGRPSDTVRHAFTN